jgi:hypothetical protein
MGLWKWFEWNFSYWMNESISGMQMDSAIRIADQIRYFKSPLIGG